MALWIYAAFATLSTQDAAHVYMAFFSHAHTGPGVWTDSFNGDVYLWGLVDTSDTEGDFTSHWGSRIDITGTQHLAETRVLVVRNCIRFHELDRLSSEFKDAVSSAKITITLSGVTVQMRELTCQLTSFTPEDPVEGETITYWSWPYYSEPEGGELLGTYYMRLKIRSITEGLQVGLFGLIERGGVVVADFLGGGGGLVGLDPASEKTQVVDCPVLASAYLAHRAHYIGFMFCFIPAELSFHEIVGPFADAEAMLVAVHAASHLTSTMTPIGWNKDVSGGEKIFTGTSTSMCVSWDSALIGTGVVGFDPAKVAMRTAGLLYDEVRGA